MIFKGNTIEDLLNGLMDSYMEGETVEGIVPVEDREFIVYGTEQLRKAIIDDNHNCFTISPNSIIEKNGKLIAPNEIYMTVNGISFTLIIEE